MPVATAESTALLVEFTLPGTPFSVPMARSYVQAALGHYDLGGYAGDIESVTAELVGNAVKHAGGPTVSLTLMRPEDSGGVVVVVSDLSPSPPVKRALADDLVNGRGLHIVEALSARWGWAPLDSGKAVFAVFTAEG